MGSIIISMPKIEDAKKISKMLKARGMETIDICMSGDAVLEKVHQYRSGVVICTRNLRDMYCNQVIENLPDYFEMLLLTSQEGVEHCPQNVDMLIMPFRTSDLFHAVDDILARIESHIQKTRTKPKKRSREEQACIDEAKRLLMEKKEMTEPEAFRYIQKCSMDSCTNLAETAQMILLFQAD